MNILHSPTNIGGQLTMLSRAQRKLGHRSDVMVFSTRYYNYESDIDLQLGGSSKESQQKRILDFFKYAIKTYDVFHFYYGKSILPNYQDLPILKSLGKKIVFTYVGHDASLRSLHMRYPINECKECTRLICNENREKTIKKNIRKVSEYADVLVCGVGLEEHVLSAIGKEEKIHTPLIVPIDLDTWTYVGSGKKNEVVKVAHAPTNREIKGTRYVVSAVKKLKSEGYRVELILVEGLSNQEARKIYMEADIIVDQLLWGWYGGFAAECMALGKPVLCYLREDLLEKYSYAQKCPIVNTNPFNIIDNLKMLIENSDLREELGRKGYEYVKEIHDSVKVAKQLCDFYETL